jgi:hypothetical protein
MINTPHFSYCPIRKEIIQDSFGELDEESLFLSVEGLVRFRIYVTETVALRTIEDGYPQFIVRTLQTGADRESRYDTIIRRLGHLYPLDFTEAIHSVCSLASDERLRNAPYWIDRWNEVRNDPDRIAFVEARLDDWSNCVERHPSVTSICSWENLVRTDEKRLPGLNWANHLRSLFLSDGLREAAGTTWDIDLYWLSVRGLLAIAVRACQLPGKAETDANRQLVSAVEQFCCGRGVLPHVSKQDFEAASAIMGEPITYLQEAVYMASAFLSTGNLKTLDRMVICVRNAVEYRLKRVELVKLLKLLRGEVLPELGSPIPAEFFAVPPTK